MLSTSNPDTDKVPAFVRSILWVDCIGAILVGGTMLLLADWLQSLFQLPPILYIAITSANLLYGTFSFVLASLNNRPIGMISTLAIANAFWGCVCIIAAISVIGHASVFGIAHILLEGAVVFSLARMEWRHRGLLSAKCVRAKSEI